MADLAVPIGGKGQPIRLSASVLQGVVDHAQIVNSPCNFTESRIITHLSKRRVNRWASYLRGLVFADPFLYFPMLNRSANETPKTGGDNRTARIKYVD